MAEQMKLSFLSTTASKIDELPIVDGQFILIKDINTIAVDMNDKRTKYEQIITLASDSDRSSILAPVNGVFYFVVETNSLWKYDQEWKMICSAQSLVPAGGSSGQVLTKQSDTNGDVSWQNPSVTDEQVTTAVNSYLEENPVSGMTAEEKQQLNKATEDVSKKLDTNQGAENKGKSMVVGEDGVLVPEYIKNGIDVEYIPEDEMLVLSGGSKNTDETPESPGPITNDIELLDTIILTPSQSQINKNLDEYNKKEYFVLVDVPKTENETYFRIGIGNIYSLQTPHACNIYSSQVYAIIHKIDKNYYGFATMNDGWSRGEVTTGIIPTPRTEEKYLALSFYPYVSGDEEAVIKIYGR